MKFTSFFAGLMMTVASWFGYAPVQVVQVAQSTPVIVATSTDAATTTMEMVDAATTTLSHSNTLTLAEQSATVSTVTSAPASANTLTGLGGDKYANGIVPLGDYDYVTSGPKKGYVYVCNVMQGGQGAQTVGPWIDSAANTWNSNEQVHVEGSVSWPNAYIHITTSGSGASETRLITSNDLPTVGTTGNFPVASTDPASQYDANPNSIEAQTLSFSLSANPVFASAPGCIYGEVGIMTNGVLLLDAFDAEYRDAEAHEILDSCDGHPHESGIYHYHSLSPCIPDATVTNIVGWAFDGYPITGPLISAATATSSARYLTTADLDECHGITSPVDENGTMVNTYHYVMTKDFPYSISCFRGKSYEPKPGPNATGGSSGASGSMSGMSGMGGMNMGGMNMQTSNTGGVSNSSGSGMSTPPAAAISACATVAAGGECSFTTPNGTISGTCQTPPNQSSLACVPSQ